MKTNLPAPSPHKYLQTLCDFCWKSQGSWIGRSIPEIDVRKNAEKKNTMETLEAIFTRRSIRECTSQAVSDELIHELMAAAMQAPSAGNQQPWHFIIVNEREQLNALAGVLPFAQMLKTAPLGIAVCADLEIARYPEFWAQDCSAATQNLLLAAHAKGLGAVWTAFYPVEDRVACVKRILGLPEQVIPLCLVPVGYPVANHEPPASRYNKTRLHYNYW